jgi:HNH endonuclease
MPVSDHLRREVAERARGQCEYCRSQALFCPDPFSIEHIVLDSKGGPTIFENLALACQGCNNAKYTFTSSADPLSGRMVRLYNPRQDHWEEHFLWAVDGLEIVGISPTGRATVERLRLNRDNVVGWRRLAIAFGIHPPVDGPRNQD